MGRGAVVVRVCVRLTVCVFACMCVLALVWGVGEWQGWPVSADAWLRCVEKALRVELSPHDISVPQVCLVHLYVHICNLDDTYTQTHAQHIIVYKHTFALCMPLRIRGIEITYMHIYVYICTYKYKYHCVYTYVYMYTNA